MPEISFRDGTAVAGDGVYVVVSRAGVRGSYAVAMRRARDCFLLRLVCYRTLAGLRSAFGKNVGV